MHWHIFPSHWLIIIQHWDLHLDITRNTFSIQQTTQYSIQPHWPKHSFLSIPLNLWNHPHSSEHLAFHKNILQSSTLQSQLESSFINFNHPNPLHCFSQTKIAPFHNHSAAQIRISGITQFVTRVPLFFIINECFDEISFCYTFINHV